MRQLKVITRDASGRATRCQLAKDEGIKVGDVRITPEGYMVAENVRIARTGVQEYSALELGLDASMKTVRLYRDPAQVFDAASMATADRKPTTYYHPEHGVDSSNWRSTAVGHVEGPKQDGDFLAVDKFIVNDRGAVEAVAFGVKEVSCGYSFKLVMESGVTPAGEAFDGRQTEIEHNHVAIVYAGRCGGGCAIGDCACPAPHAPNRTQPGDTPMATRTINLGKFPITLDEKDALIVEAHIGDIAAAVVTATKRATDAEGALTAQGDAMKKLAADHKTALDAATAKILTPEQQAALVGELSAVAADAKAVLPEFDAKGKTAGAIRVEVLTSILAEDGALKTTVSKILGGVEPAKAGDVRVLAAFDTVVATAGTTDDGGESEREIADALTGDKKTGAAGKTQKLSGRALMIARSRGQVARDNRAQ